MINEYSSNYNFLKQAAKQLFDAKVQKLKEEKPIDGIFLDDKQVEELSIKILLLPEDWQDALLLYYGGDFRADIFNSLLDDPGTADNILYIKDTLAYAMNIPSISADSLQKACHLVLHNLHTQIKTEQHNAPIKTSKKLDKRVQSLIQKNDKIKVKFLAFYVIVKRVAVFILALLITSAITILSVEALRTKFFEWLFSIFPTHTRVEFVDVALPSDVDYADQLNQYAPTYLPEGFVLMDTAETDIYNKLYYANSKEQYIVFEVRLINEQNHININTENFSFEKILINGFEGYYSVNDFTHILVWSDDYCMFKVLCDTTKYDAIKIAESTKLK